MIKSGLNIYKKNIWEVFALVGFISIGLIIAFIAIFPSVSSLFNNSIGRIASEASGLVSGFKKDTFFIEVSNALSKLDWANPIKTIQDLLQNNGLFNLLVSALKKSGVGDSEIVKLGNVINSVIKDGTFIITNITIVFISIIGVTGLIGYLLTKIIVQTRSTSNHNPLKFALSFLLNLIVIGIAIFLLLLTIVNVNNGLFYLALIGIILLMLILSLLISILVYKKDECRFSDLFNFKTVGGLLLSTLIVIAISGLLIMLIYIFSDFIALIIAIPLLIITNIIIENITIKYVTDFKTKKE